MKPFRAGITDGSGEVTLTDEQWRTLREKLDRFQFRFADQVIVDFGMMIRNAPEIGTEQQAERP
jgi:hypothetical protein